MNAPTPDPRQTRARLVLVLLALLFFGGLVIAAVMIQTGWRPATTKNYGELVQPPRPLADAELATLDGARLRLADLKGKWTFVYFGSAECRTPCIDNLYKMRQVAAAQGKESHRVRRLFVVTETGAVDALRYTLKDYPGTHVVVGPAAEVQRLVTQFGADGDAHRLYIVDPLGNLMMRYPADADPRGINKDLGLLLRASRIG